MGDDSPSGVSSADLLNGGLSANKRERDVRSNTYKQALGSGGKHSVAAIPRPNQNNTGINNVTVLLR